MTPAIQRFIELERKKSEVKKYFDELQAAVEAVSKEIGINGHFQDDQGIVYQIVIPKGKFVYFEPVSYVRTKRAGEERGDLSVSKAKELGYDI